MTQQDQGIVLEEPIAAEISADSLSEPEQHALNYIRAKLRRTVKEALEGLARLPQTWEVRVFVNMLKLFDSDILSGK